MDEKPQLPDGKAKPTTLWPLIWALVWSAAVGTVLPVFIPRDDEVGAFWLKVAGACVGFTPAVLIFAWLMWQRRR